MVKHGSAEAAQNTNNADKWYSDSMMPILTVNEYS